MGNKIKQLKYFINGKWVKSKTNKYMTIWNPGTGEKLAETPCCKRHTSHRQNQQVIYMDNFMIAYSAE